MSRTGTKERMPERPSWCSLGRWTEYKWKATARQGAAARRKLAEEYDLPLIPATILSL